MRQPSQLSPIEQEGSEGPQWDGPRTSTGVDVRSSCANSGAEASAVQVVTAVRMPKDLVTGKQFRYIASA